jgi:hypothetical protein
MVIWGMMIWWYTLGWRQCLEQVKSRIEATLDFFSIGLLLRTLFAPFRQISAGQVRGSLSVQIQAFFDRLISRIIGMAVRLLMIMIGSLTIVINATIGVVMIGAWAVVPLLPFIGLGLYLLGWMPWSN